MLRKEGRENGTASDTETKSTLHQIEVEFMKEDDFK